MSDEPKPVQVDEPDMEEQECEHTPEDGDYHQYIWGSDEAEA